MCLDYYCLKLIYFEKKTTKKHLFSADGDIGRSLASDGVFLYTTNACGRGLAKIGSGLHGSIRYIN